MKPLPLSSHFSQASPLIFGCMGLGGGWNNNPVSADDLKVAHQAIDAALEIGIRVFDHADIYTLGKAEKVFAKILMQRPELREQIILQSKCGIRFEDEQTPKRYDFSAQWIQQSVDGILARLDIDQLDILMLHRPDPLMEPDEISDTFALLQQQGKVKNFGVSNMHAPQMMALQTSLKTPLVTNQLELSLSHLSWLEEGVTAGCSGFNATNFTSGTIEYCRQNKVQLQSWGCLSQGLFTGKDTSNSAEHIQKTAKLVCELAHNYQASTEAIVLAWLRRHPSSIQPVIGTTNVERIKACGQVNNLTLSRDHWYALYVAARGSELP